MVFVFYDIVFIVLIIRVSDFFGVFVGFEFVLKVRDFFFRKS